MWDFIYIMKLGYTLFSYVGVMIYPMGRGNPGVQMKQMTFAHK